MKSNIVAKIAILIAIALAWSSASFAQTGVMDNNNGRTPIQGIDGSVVFITSEEVHRAGCSNWFRGVSYHWELNTNLSRGDISEAPSRLIGVAIRDGIRFEIPNTPLYGNAGYIEPTYYGSLTWQGIARNSDGCIISWIRSDYETSEVIDGNEYRFVLNWRNDGRVGARYLRVTNGRDIELARYVFQRTREARLSNPEELEGAEFIIHQPASAPSGYLDRSPHRRVRR